MQNANIYCSNIVFPNNSSIYGSGSNFVVNPLIGPTGPPGTGGFSPDVVGDTGAISGSNPTTLLSGSSHSLENGPGSSIVKTIYNNMNNSYYPLTTGGLNGSSCNASVYDNARNYLYAGGAFTSAGGATVSNIAMWQPGNAPGIGTWYPLGSGLSSSCNALTLDNTGNLYAGGAFTSAGGTGAPYIAMWQPGNTGGTGNWYTLGSGLNNLCIALAYDSTRNYLYVGGSFSTAGGVSTRSRIAMWQPGNTGGTGTWYSLGSGLGGTSCNALTLDNIGNLYVGGNFTSAGGTSATGIAVWQPGNTGGTGTWYSLGSGISYTNMSVANTVNSLVFDPFGNLYIGGLFSGSGNIISRNIIRWTPGVTLGQGSYSAIKRGLDASVQTMAYDSLRNILFISGAFVSDFDKIIIRFCYYDGNDFKPLGSGMTNVNNTLTIAGNTLYLAGTNTVSIARFIASLDIPSIISVTNSNMVDYGTTVPVYSYTSATGYAMLVWDGTNWFTGLRKF